jgi:hypothetical protein
MSYGLSAQVNCNMQVVSATGRASFGTGAQELCELRRAWSVAGPCLHGASADAIDARWAGRSRADTNARIATREVR